MGCRRGQHGASDEEEERCEQSKEYRCHSLPRRMGMRKSESDHRDNDGRSNAVRGENHQATCSPQFFNDA